MNNTHTVSLVAALATAVGLVAASCGDDPEPLTKPEFISQANAICESTNARMEPILDGVYAGVDDIDWDDPANRLLLFVRFDEAMDEVMPIIDEQLDDIRALGSPVGDEELITALLDDQEAAVDEFARLMAAAADGDESALATLDSDEDPFEEIDRRARAYGLTVCGENDG